MNTIADGSEKTDAATIIDLAAIYKLNKNLSFTGKIDNVFDKHYIASRHPYGIRVNAPRLIYAGIKLNF